MAIPSASAFPSWGRFPSSNDATWSRRPPFPPAPWDDASTWDGPSSERVS